MNIESTGAPGSPGREPVRSPVHGTRPAHPRRGRRGQVATPPDAGAGPVGAARTAGAHDDGAAGGGRGLRRRAARAAAPQRGTRSIGRADSIRVVVPLGWRSANPALLVARRLGFAEGDEPAELMVSAIGGNAPQALMHDACGAISRGDLDVVLVTGAEAMYARSLARRDPDRAARVGGASRSRGHRHPCSSARTRPGATDLEMNRGVLLPVHAYPLFENALPRRQRVDPRRARRPHRRPLVALQRGGRGNPARLDPHPAHGRRDRHPVAGQPDGLVPLSEAVHGQHAGRPGRRLHRVLGGGGPRRRGARGSLGLPARRRRRQRPLVHLAAAPSCTAPPPSGSPAPPRSSWPGSGIDDVASVDLYSCFPVVVQMAAAELGLAVDDPGRPLTLTGGLTFGGGPGNNYTSHGIAQRRRRAARRRRGRQRSSPAWAGTPPSTPSGSTPRGPPAHGGRGRSPGATSSPRSTPCPSARSTPTPPGRCASRPTPSPSTARRAPERGIVACTTADGSRAWGNVDDPDALALLCAEEGIGRTGVLAPDGVLTLDG